MRLPTNLPVRKANGLGAVLNHVLDQFLCEEIRESIRNTIIPSCLLK
jgi:hypothetical protein